MLEDLLRPKEFFLYSSGQAQCRAKTVFKFRKPLAPRLNNNFHNVRQHLLSTYNVPGTVGYALQMQSFLTKTLGGLVIIIPILQTRKLRRLREFKQLAKVTASGKQCSKNKAQDYLTSDLDS